MFSGAHTHPTHTAINILQAFRCWWCLGRHVLGNTSVIMLLCWWSELFALNGSSSAEDYTLWWWWELWQIYCQAGIGGGDELQKCASIQRFYSLFPSLCLIDASPLCPLVRFSNHELEAVKVLPFQPHNDASRRRRRKRISYTKSTQCFYWIMKNLWQQFDLVYHAQLVLLFCMFKI